MIQIQVRDLFQAVERLHQLELFEDLCLYVELHLPNEPAKMFMNSADDLKEDQRGYIFCCLADAYANLGYFTKAIQNYEMALQYLNNIKHRKLNNDYEQTMNSAEIRFRMHKILLRNRQEQEALHCLESIARADYTPKVLFAMAQLCHQLAKNNRRMDAANTRTINYLKTLRKEVPEAVFCKSWLLSLGAIKQTISSTCVSNLKTQQFQQQQHISNAKIENLNTTTAQSPLSSQFIVTPELNVWMEMKQLHAQKSFIEAAKLLDKLSTGPNLRFLLERAYLYRIAGDYQKAMTCYQQAHMLDCTNAEGMDALAALLGTQPNSNSHQVQRELDQLAIKIHGTNPRRPETFVIFGWAARQCHRAAEARQFMLRAEQLAQKRGRQRCEVLLLKAQLLFDTKRNYKEIDVVLSDALHNDCTNTSVYALYIQMYMAQKRFTEAQKMAKTSMRFVGEQNYQIRLLFAQALADDSSSTAHSSTEQAISLLEKMVQDGQLVSLDPLLLLSRLYERYQKYDKAIALLNRFKESYADPRIHQELGQILAKTNRSMEASSEYGQAAVTAGAGAATKDRIINMMSGFTTPPQSAINAAFEHSGTITGLGASNNSSGIQSAVSPRARPQVAMRMPPPVARVTRRTAVNQHEQLRRLRGLGTYSATGSPGGNSIGARTQMRRLATRGGTTAATRLAAVSGTAASRSIGNSSGGSGLMLADGGRQLLFDSLSTISSRHFLSSSLQQNNEEGDVEEFGVEREDNESSAEASDDDSQFSSQLSLEESGTEDNGAANRNSGVGNNQRRTSQQLRHDPFSSSSVDQSRGTSSNGGASTLGGDSDPHQATIVRHMVRDIRRFFAATTTQTVTDAAAAASTTTTTASTSVGTNVVGAATSQFPGLQRQNEIVTARSNAIPATATITSDTILDRIVSTAVSQQQQHGTAASAELQHTHSISPSSSARQMRATTSSGSVTALVSDEIGTLDANNGSTSLLSEVQLMEIEPSPTPTAEDTSNMNIDDSANDSMELFGEVDPNNEMS